MEKEVTKKSTHNKTQTRTFTNINCITNCRRNLPRIDRAREAGSMITEWSVHLQTLYKPQKRELTTSFLISWNTHSHSLACTHTHLHYSRTCRGRSRNWTNLRFGRSFDCDWKTARGALTRSTSAEGAKQALVTTAYGSTPSSGSAAAALRRRSAVDAAYQTLPAERQRWESTRAKASAHFCAEFKELLPVRKLCALEMCLSCALSN